MPFLVHPKQLNGPRLVKLPQDILHLRRVLIRPCWLKKSRTLRFTKKTVEDSVREEERLDLFSDHAINRTRHIHQNNNTA